MQQQQDTRRLSVLTSILLSYSVVMLMAGGMGWLSFHKQAQTISTVTVLYNQAFEGVNNAHWAYSKFEHLMLLKQARVAPEDQQKWAQSILEHLGIARQVVFDAKEAALIDQIVDNMVQMSREEAAGATAGILGRDMMRLIRHFMADRVETRERSVVAIERSRNVVIGLLGVTVIFVMISAVVLIMAMLPQLRHAVSIAQLIAGGKLDNDIVVKGLRETATLLQSLKAMQGALSQNISNLEAARERAIKSENVKSEFLANMSHELRTPLNNIIGSIHLLQDGAANEKDRELLGLVERSSLSLLGIVNDILDLSKIEAGEVRLEHIGFDVLQKIRDVTRMFMAQAAKKDIAISCAAEGRLAVLGDPHRFERILTNLVGNALRYTEKGSIRINTVMAKEGDRLRLRVEVVDTGIGIPADKIDKIFERFTQSDSSMTRKYGGTGLGLTITRELVHMMRGRIGVTSEVGKGSTFWFEIPFEETDSLEDAKAASQQGALVKHEGAIPVDKIRILVAEDHELNRALMRRLFQHLGISSYVFAETGREAVEEVQKRSFDLVLMDGQMPEMDGYAATAAIRALPDEKQKSIPIVAMTANAMESEKERCLKAGMNAYISKPFEFDVFKRTLSPWVDFTSGRSEAEAVKSDESGVPDMTNLISMSNGDDNYVREMIEVFLETAQLNVATLRTLADDSGGEAWANEAHALKGAAGIVGAGRLRFLAGQAQNMEGNAAAKGEIADAIDGEFQKLKVFFLNYLKKQA